MHPLVFFATAAGTGSGAGLSHPLAAMLIFAAGAAVVAAATLLLDS